MRLPKYDLLINTGIDYIGEIPKHWDFSKRIRHICKAKKGKNPSTQETEMKDGYLPYLTAAYLRGGEPDFWVPNDGPRGNDDDILLLWDGSNAGELFKSKEGIVGSTFVLLRTNSILKQYFWYLLKSYESYIKDTSIGMGIPHVNGDALKNLQALIPSDAEQEKIVNFLDRETAKIDDLIQKQEKLIDFSLEARQALISHVMTKGVNQSKLKQTGVKWFKEIPSSWHHSKLGLYSKRIVVGIAEAATQAYQDSGTPILRATNIRPMKIIGDLLYLSEDFADDRESKSLKAGDLVTVRTGNAGVTALITKELDGCQCFTMLITTVNDRLAPEFMNYWMNSSQAQSYFSIEGWGTAQVNISVPILKQLPIPIPPLLEQKEIVSYLDSKTLEIDDLINKTRESLLLLKEHRASLISAAVTGKIDVRKLV